MDNLLTRAEAAAIIGRSEARIGQLIKAGKIQVERFEDGSVRIRESVARAYKAKITIPDALPNLPATAQTA